MPAPESQSSPCNSSLDPIDLKSGAAAGAAALSVLCVDQSPTSTGALGKQWWVPEHTFLEGMPCTLAYTG